MNFYYCTDGETVEGPVCRETLEDFFVRSLLSPSTLVCPEGHTDWAFITTLFSVTEDLPKPPPRRSRRQVIENPEYEIILRDVPFTRRQRASRSLHVLQGMLMGFSLSGDVSAEELAELRSWTGDHKGLFSKPPFSEILPKVDLIIQSGRLTSEDRDDLVWLCQQLSEATPFYDGNTADIQRLHGLLHGALADGQLRDVEIEGIRAWLAEHRHLSRSFPYDELVSLLNSVLADGRVDDEERATLVYFFERFVTYSSAKASDKVFESGIPPRRLSGICALNPCLEFRERRFSFTGASTVAPRRTIASIIEELGGLFTRSVSRETDYLVVGDAGNPAWTYACYGRKVEEAMKIRAAGFQLVLVHESDFWPQVEALRGSPIVP